MNHHVPIPTSLRLRIRRPLLAIPLAQTQPPPPPPPPPASQTAPTPPNVSPAILPHRHITFDIAVFKLSTTSPKGLVFPPGGDGFISTNRPIHDLIRYVYATTSGMAFHFSGQPLWVDDDHYDIQAKVAPEDLAAWQRLDPPGQKAALGDFLVDWLKLKFHYDTHLYPFFELVVAKGGPKLKVSPADDVFKGADGKPLPTTTIVWTSYDEITAKSATMNQLAQSLTGHADRTVVDHTGLTGKYSFTLQVNWDSSPDTGTPDASGHQFYEIPFEYTAPSIFTSIRTLGLELKPAKGPIDGIVIDHIERPPAN